MRMCKVNTKRLILRPIRSRDYKIWYDAHVNGHPSKSKWDLKPMKPEKCTPAKFKKMILKLRELAKKDDYYRYYVFDKNTKAIVGQIDFDVFVRGTHQFANFGYQIFNRHWGKGFGQEAARKGLKIGFQILKLNRLEAAINLDNKKSIRLVKNIGMQKEGIKKRYWFEYGKWTDHIIYVANPEDIGLKPNKPK